MKRKTFIAALLVVCLSLMAAGSIAYFNAEDAAHNVITTGKVQIELKEWSDEGKTTPWDNDTDGVGVLPGDTVVKIAEVKNTGAADAYIRVSLDCQVSLDDTYGALLNGSDPDLTKIRIKIGKDWEDGGDGFYYYSKPLKVGETSSPIFEEVVFDTTMGNEFQKATADVVVNAYAVQVANNGSSAKGAAGWPAAAEETSPAAIQ